MAVSIVQRADLRALNTLRVAARCLRLVTVTAPGDLAEAIDAARAATGEAPTLVLGGGSNLVFTGDYEGPVLRVHTRGCAVLGVDGDNVVVEAQAGESWNELVRWTLAQRLYGLENLSLIPGSVGAAPIQNIGAYGVELRERFVGLDAVDLASGEQRVFDRPACRFGYRDSVFKHAGGDRWVVARVRLGLSRTPRARSDYADLRDELARAGIANPSPEDVARAVIAVRSRKLPDPAMTGNAGSFFKNPVTDAATAAALRERNPTMAQWPVEGGVKLSAAWMIEACGLKGAREGDAGVHARHALVLVNHGGASGAQILALAGKIRDAVAQRFGVVLEVEPRVV